VATSRKRERELARRRFERRRQQELARRARAKRRNTILGSVLATAVVLAVVGVVIASLAGGSTKKKTSVDAAATATPSASTPSSASTSPPPAAPTHCAKISPDPPAKGQPTIPQVTGKAPTKLVVKDVKKGHGRAAQKGDTLSVTYIGVACSTGKVFDASYKHGNTPFPVKPLGTAQVIQGWNQGLIGMKAGGVRELVIPASLGYGTQGSPPTIKGNETLIFLVTAKSVKA
jgi:FKBP-type peptidyl-prolyl cis-trans isomerase